MNLAIWACHQHDFPMTSLKPSPNSLRYLKNCAQILPPNVSPWQSWQQGSGFEFPSISHCLLDPGRSRKTLCWAAGRRIRSRIIPAPIHRASEPSRWVFVPPVSLLLPGGKIRRTSACELQIFRRTWSSTSALPLPGLLPHDFSLHPEGVCLTWQLFTFRMSQRWEANHLP